MKGFRQVKLQMDTVEDILKRKGVTPGGKVQKFLTSEIQRVSDPYVPFGAGVLKTNISTAPDATEFTHESPYSRYHWFGKKMVDPKTGKGSFYDPATGRHWSRPGVAKVLTDIDLEYQGAPLRGPKWTMRAWVDQGKQVVASVQKFLERG
ncbi:MAG: hypothetical protein CVU86_06975 [Firmicutes bacterium HGW-Firmicutes-11]|jgi:hypothetical protein|nr:MAG: hypothetical protein CVU94_07940 [Firmicutes bacterium HGW-Firmicutes-19]PKM84467.1 MAG: hypothetical protein CVU86_06975 [Firmicutes bacterium HGW-Firmicutes-11]